MWFKRVSIVVIISILALISKYKSKATSSNLGQDVEITNKIDIDMDELNKNTNDDDNNLGLTPEELMKLAVKEVEAAEEYEEQRKNKPQMASRGKVKRIYKSVPNAGTSMKSYMDYKCIKDKTSKQYKILQENDIYIDDEGFVRKNELYLVAVGTYYAKQAGVLLEIELSTGYKFKAIVADIKDDNDTDSNNMYHKTDGSVIEFVVNVKNKKNEKQYPTLGKYIKKNGDCSYANDDKFKGEVVSIVILEEEE